MVARDKLASTDDHDLAALRLIEPLGANFKMYVTPRFEWHYLNNAYEPYTARLLVKMCERASLFVDIGAHYGFFTLHAASSRPGLRVVAIEPAKSNFEVLKRNVNLNRLKNVEIHNVAISDTAGKKPFHVFEASDNCGFHIHPLSKLLRTEKVRTTTIDTILSNVPPGPIVIKIDTEGHEIALLAGMKQTMRRQDVALFIEFNPKMLKAAGRDPAELLQNIDELGLATFLLDDSNHRHFRIGPQTNWSAHISPGGYANLVCLPKSRALNVLFMSHSSGVTGAERSLLELVDELIADYWVLATVICPSTGPLPDLLQSIGAAICIVPYGWWCALDKISDTKPLIAQDVRTILRLVPLLRDIDPDVVWTQSLVIPWGAVIALLLGKRHVWSICEYGEKDHHIRFFLPFKEVLKFVEHSSDFVFAGSPSLLAELLPQLSSDKADYLFRHIQIPKRPRSLGTKFWKVKGATRIAIFGTIQEGKGQEDMVRAVARLRRVELLIAGSASGDGYLERLQSLVSDLKVAQKVSFPGFIEDPYAVMASTDIVVSCSRSEGFGRTLVEAMLLGRAVVYPRSGAPLDYMVEGTTGISYEPGNISELVERLQTLIAAPKLRNSLGRKARVYATKTFTRSGYGGKVYHKLVALRDSDDRRTADMSDVSKLLYAGIDALGPSEAIEAASPRLLDEVRDRDQRLIAAHEELSRVASAAANDRQALAGEIRDRDERLIAADGDLRRLLVDLEVRDQKLQIADQDLRRLIAEIADKDRQLVAADGQLRHVMGEIEDRERRLIGEIGHRDHQLVAADGQLRHLMEEIEDRERRLTEADGELRRLIAEVEQRDRQRVAADGQLRHLMEEVEDREQRLTDVDGELRRLIAEVEQRDRQLIAADGQLRHLVGEVEDRDRRLTVADSDLGRLRSEAQDRERKLTANDDELRRLVAEAEDRNQRLAALDNERRRLIKDLDERGRRLDLADTDRQRLIAEAEDRAQQLAGAEQRLKNIEASRSWRMITAIQRLVPGRT
jgi:FkbM family methyltransferase